MIIKVYFQNLLFIKFLFVVTDRRVPEAWVTARIAPHLFSFILVLVFHSHLRILKCGFHLVLCSLANKRLITCCALNMKVKLLMHPRKGNFKIYFLRSVTVMIFNNHKVVLKPPITTFLHPSVPSCKSFSVCSVSPCQAREQKEVHWPPWAQTQPQPHKLSAPQPQHSASMGRNGYRHQQSLWVATKGKATVRSWRLQIVADPSPCLQRQYCIGETG